MARIVPVSKGLIQRQPKWVDYRKWIQEEIAIAAAYGKTVICVIHSGQEKVPIDVQTAANEMFGWITGAIVAAFIK